MTKRKERRKMDREEEVVVVDQGYLGVAGVMHHSFQI
jgi:hypothetical protein